MRFSKGYYDAGKGVMGWWPIGLFLGIFFGSLVYFLSCWKDNYFGFVQSQWLCSQWFLACVALGIVLMIFIRNIFICGKVSSIGPRVLIRGGLDGGAVRAVKRLIWSKVVSVIGIIFVGAGTLFVVRDLGVKWLNFVDVFYSEKYKLYVQMSVAGSIAICGLIIWMLLHGFRNIWGELMVHHDNVKLVGDIEGEGFSLPMSTIALILSLGLGAFMGIFYFKPDWLKWMGISGEDLEIKKVGVVVFGIMLVVALSMVMSYIRYKRRDGRRLMEAMIAPDPEGRLSLGILRFRERLNWVLWLHLFSMFIMVMETVLISFTVRDLYPVKWFSDEMVKRIIRVYVVSLLVMLVMNSLLIIVARIRSRDELYSRKGNILGSNSPVIDFLEDNWISL